MWCGAMNVSPCFFLTELSHRRLAGVQFSPCVHLFLHNREIHAFGRWKLDDGDHG